MDKDFPEMKRLAEGDSLPSGLQLGDGRQVNLSSAVDDRVLDGNQYAGTVQTVDREVLSNPEFTGVNWILEAAAGGTWRLLNQGDLECGLSGSSGMPRLGHLSADVTQPDPTGHWLIYSHGSRGDVMLRPLRGEWLRVDDEGGVLLGRCATGEEQSALWRVS